MIPRGLDNPLDAGQEAAGTRGRWCVRSGARCVRRTNRGPVLAVRLFLRRGHAAGQLKLPGYTAWRRRSQGGDWSWRDALLEPPLARGRFGGAGGLAGCPARVRGGAKLGWAGCQSASGTGCVLSPSASRKDGPGHLLEGRTAFERTHTYTHTHIHTHIHTHRGRVSPRARATGKAYGRRTDLAYSCTIPANAPTWFAATTSSGRCSRHAQRLPATLGCVRAYFEVGIPLPVASAPAGRTGCTRSVQTRARRAKTVTCRCKATWRDVRVTCTRSLARDRRRSCVT